MAINRCKLKLVSTSTTIDQTDGVQSLVASIVTHSLNEHEIWVLDSQAQHVQGH
jgi:hypothetical protein